MKIRLMSIFKKNKQKKEAPPIQSWESIVDALYDEGLDAFCNEVIRVIYSKDRSMMYVILKDEKNLLTYELEAIYQFDNDEWQYLCSHRAIPAMWEPYRGVLGSSVFARVEDLLRELMAEPEYKKFFE